MYRKMTKDDKFSLEGSMLAISSDFALHLGNIQYVSVFSLFLIPSANLAVCWLKTATT